MLTLRAPGTPPSPLPRHQGGLYQLYVSFLEYRQREIARSLRLMMDASALPVLVHCMQGKDRTGILVALLLHIAGCSKEDVRSPLPLSILTIEQNERVASLLA